MGITLKASRNLLASRLFGRGTEPVGAPPGTLVPTSDDNARVKPRITAITYSETEFTERETGVAECDTRTGSGVNVWVNVDGLGDSEVLGELGRKFGIHELVLEDILNTTQRPKIDEHDDYLFIVLKMIYPGKGSGDVEVEQVSLILKKNVLISFQEHEGDVFGLIRDRLRSATGRVRRMNADYLAYALMDAIVDHYFVVMERLGDEIEMLEQQILEAPEPRTGAALHALRTRIILLRRSVWPLREVVSGLMRSESPLIRKPTFTFMRDLYDHTIQVIETLETYRDMLGGMLDLHLSSVSNHMNEVMKVLTIIATLFIPLSFIAGVYGMNFQHMPELAFSWGYPAALGLMVLTAAGFLAYFRKKRWL